MRPEVGPQNSRQNARTRSGWYERTSAPLTGRQTPTQPIRTEVGRPDSCSRDGLGGGTVRLTSDTLLISPATKECTVADYSPDEQQLAAQVDAAIEARWQAAEDRYARAMADLDRRRRRANRRLALVFAGSALYVTVVAVGAAWINR